MFFNVSHVTHLAHGSLSERARRDSLRRCVAVGGDHTVELFIFSKFFYKGLCEFSRAPHRGPGAFFCSQDLLSSFALFQYLSEYVRQQVGVWDGGIG